MNKLLLLLNHMLRGIAQVAALAILPTLISPGLLAQGGEAILGTSPFGFQCGMTAEQVVGVAGKNSAEEPLGGLKRLELTAAPRPHSAFVSYSLIVTPEQGVVMINAKGFKSSSSSAAELRDVFADIRGALSGIYGKPTQNLDLSGDDAFSISGQTAVASSVPRHWAAVWDVAQPSRHHLQSIILNAEQASKYFFLSYECDGIEGISDGTKAAVLAQASVPTAFLPTARHYTATVAATPTNRATRTSAAPLEPAETPFGFWCGMSAAEIRRLVGSNAVVGTHGDLLTLKTAPRPLGLVESYELAVSPEDGLIRIDGRVYVDPVGGQMFHTFTALRDATTSVYGAPDTSWIPLKGSASAIWNLKSSLPGGLDGIVLLEDRSTTKANVLLSYECKGFGDYLDRKKK